MVDPAYKARAMPIVAWSRAVWLQRLSPPDMDCILNWAMERSAEHAEPWRCVTGPGQAYVLSLARLAWGAKSSTVIRLDDGRTMDLTEVPPAVVAQEVKAAVDR